MTQLNLKKGDTVYYPHILTGELVKRTVSDVANDGLHVYLVGDVFWSNISEVRLSPN